MRPTPVHPDTLAAVLPHYNDEFRLRYRLPAVLEPYLRTEVPDIETRLGAADEVRLERGIADASCALLAQLILSATPQFGIGVLLGDRVDMTPSPLEDPKAYRGGWVLLVNPLAGIDNWTSTTRAFRRFGFRDARRRALAELSSVGRPDEERNQGLLRDAMERHGRAVVLPPDDGFSIERAAEVAFIYRTTVETLRDWNQTYRADLLARRSGRPRKKPRKSAP